MRDLHLRLLASTTATAAIVAAAFGSPALAQACPPGPVSVNGTACTVTGGPAITVTSSATPGLNATNPGGAITANGITVNLGPGAVPNAIGLIGARALTAGAIILNGGSIITLQAGNGQRGAIASGAGSTITATDATIALGTGTNVNDNLAVVAEAGGVVTLFGATVSTSGGGNGNSNHGLFATGAGSAINFSSGSVSTASRGSFGALAQGGAVVTLSDGAQITTTGQQIVAGSIGSHGLVATGSGSEINGSGIAVSTSGALANGARAESGGVVSLTSSSITSSSTSGLDTEPSSAARVLSGGTLTLSGPGSSIATTGLRSHGVSVQDAGSQAFISDTAISVSGSRANGIKVFNAGAATLTDSSVQTNTAAGVAALAETGSTLEVTDSSITATAPTAHGLRSLTDSSIIMTGGSVTTEGRDAAALSAGLATITATDVTIATHGIDTAIGVVADGASTIRVTGGSVTTSGNSVRDGARPHALVARNPGGTLIVSGTTVLTTGYEAMGVVADDGGVVTLSDVSVRTEDTLNLGPRGTGAIGLFSVVEQVGSQFAASLNGNNVTVETFGPRAHGALAQQNFLEAPATITLNDSSITTHGLGAVGLRAVSAGTVIANDSTIFSEGIAAHGSQARDNGSSVTLDQTTVTSTGANAHGAVAEAGGLITGIDATVRATGTNAAALYAAGASEFVSVANFTGSTLSNVSGPTIGVGGVANISLTNSTAGGSGQWLRVGTITDFPPLALPEAPITGVPDLPEDPDIEPPAFPPLFLTPGALPVEPGLANIFLFGSTVTGSAFTASGSVSNVTMINNSIWNLTGSSNLTNLTNDASLIDFSPVGSFKTLTTVNYGGAGGTIRLNTFLGTDGSPSDLLVIDGGSATGNTALAIRNAGGPGALTVSDGIMVVDATNGVTDPAAFFLAGRVVAGTFDYELFRGGLDPSSNPESWFLRSIGEIRPETSLYSAIPAISLLYGRDVIGTLHERVGELEHLRGRADLDGSPYNNGAWARVLANRGEHDGHRLGVLGEGPAYDLEFYAFQFGHDFYRAERTDGARDHIGVYLAVGSSDGKVLHLDGSNAGKDRFNAYSLGAYWTYFGPSGAYLDTVLQSTRYNAKAQPEGLPTFETKGLGLAASVEAGYPIRFGNGFSIEPQVQLVYQHVDTDTARDAGALIRFSDAESLTGRIGARFAWSWAYDSGPQPRMSTIWLRSNLWHEFMGDTKTEFSTAIGFMPFRANTGWTTAEINGGIDVQLSRTIYLYANAGYRVTTDGDNRGYNGRIGIRGNW